MILLKGQSHAVFYTYLKISMLYVVFAVLVKKLNVKENIINYTPFRFFLLLYFNDIL